jgi:hypothetical protein
LISEEVSKIQKMMGIKAPLIMEAALPINPQAEKEILEWIIGLFTKAEGSSIRTAAGKEIDASVVENFLKRTNGKLESLGLQRGLNQLTKEETDILKAITKDEMAKNRGIFVDLVQKFERTYYKLNQAQKEAYIGSYMNRMGKILSDSDMNALKNELEVFLPHVKNPGHSSTYNPKKDPTNPLYEPNTNKPITPTTSSAPKNDFTNFFSGGPGARELQYLDALKNGTNIIAGHPSKEVEMLKPYYDKGLIKSKEDVYYKIKELYSHQKLSAVEQTGKATTIFPDVTIEGTFDGYKVLKGVKENAIGDIRQEAQQARNAGKKTFTKETIKDGKKIYTLVDPWHADNFGRGGFKAVSVSLPENTNVVIQDVMPTLEAAMKDEKAVPIKVEPKTALNSVAQQIGGFNGLVGDEITSISTEPGEYAWTLDLKNGQYVVNRTTFPNIAEIIKRPESLIKPMFIEQNVAKMGENKITITKPAVFQKGDNGKFILKEKGELWYGESPKAKDDVTKPTIKNRPYETGDVVVTGTKPGSGGGTVYGNYELPDFRRALSKGNDTGIHFVEFIYGDKKVFSLIDGSVLDGPLLEPEGRNGYIATSIVLDKNTTTTLSEVKADLEELHALARTGLNKNNKIDVEKVKQVMNGYRWASHEVKPVERLIDPSVSAGFPIEEDQTKLRDLYNWFDSKFYEAKTKRHDTITDAQIAQMLPETKKYILTILEDLKEYHPSYRDGKLYNRSTGEVVTSMNGALKEATKNLWGGFGRYNKFYENNRWHKTPFPPVHAPTRAVIDNMEKIFPSFLYNNGMDIKLSY